MRSKDGPSNQCLDVRAGSRIGVRERTGFFCTTTRPGQYQGEPAGQEQGGAHCRRSLVEDKNLSTYAHNVKIIAQNGMVTLKGPVRSNEEKTAVEAKAAEIAGADKVTSQLEVKPKQ